MLADNKVKTAREILLNFGKRTGITGTEKADRRYLWTDAFAVHAFFALHNITGQDEFINYAIRTIDLVHEHLGKFHPDDNRKGFISGLKDEEAKQHPTLRGLRIGKSLPEREKNECYNFQLEWERDGQYFHYISRWIQALLRAQKETAEVKYATWASELFLSTDKFIYEQDGGTANVLEDGYNAFRPLISSMGAHDPLEGLLCGKSIQQMLPEKKPDVDELVEKFEQLCRGKDWSTRDTLGIGALLLNVIQSAELKKQGRNIEPSATPKKLLDASLSSLEKTDLPAKDKPLAGRLAFRECGLSLGLKACKGKQEILTFAGLDAKKLEEYKDLAMDIEEFWLDPIHQRTGTWKDHLDINSVTLACSLIGEQFPEE